jgi:hypothetical protein
MTIDHRAQVLALLGDALVHTTAQFLFHCPQLGSHAIGTRQPQYHESTFA